MDKASKVLMKSGRFMEFSVNIVDLTTFKVLQCNEYPHKRDVVVHRGVFVPCYLTSPGYNPALAPKSDAYLPFVQVEGGSPIKTVPLEHQQWIPPILS